MNDIRRKNSIILVKNKSTIINSTKINYSKQKQNLRIQNNKNIPIFNYPEELINSINHLKAKVNEDAISYKTSRELVDEYNLKFEEINKDFNKYFGNYLKSEKNLLNKLKYQKKRNNILNLKLESLNKSTINEENVLKKIVLKLKNILLKINSIYKIKDKFNKNQWDSIISNNNSFEDINENISNSFYFLKILEQTIEELIDNKNKFKNNILLKEIYRKITYEIERTNNIKRCKINISLANKREEEKKIKIIEKNRKNRLGSLFKNRISSYDDKIREKLLLKKNLSYKKNIYLNKHKYDESKELLSFY